MAMVDESCTDFVSALASKAPVPGGGGAAALVGAVGTALGSMVGNLTSGKRKYADVQEDIASLIERADAVRRELLALVDRDAEVFEPLSRAYGLPRETEEERAEKARVMEACLREACSVPMEIMQRCCEAIDLHVEFAEKGSVMAISDAGCGAAFCRAALQAAGLNVFINTRSMQDRSHAAAIEEQADRMLDVYVARADEVADGVARRLRGQERQ